MASGDSRTDNGVHSISPSNTIRLYKMCSIRYTQYDRTPFVRAIDYVFNNIFKRTKKLDCSTLQQTLTHHYACVHYYNNNIIILWICVSYLEYIHIYILYINIHFNWIVYVCLAIGGIV